MRKHGSVFHLHRTYLLQLCVYWGVSWWTCWGSNLLLLEVICNVYTLPFVSMILQCRRLVIICVVPIVARLRDSGCDSSGSSGSGCDSSGSPSSGCDSSSPTHQPQMPGKHTRTIELTWQSRFALLHRTLWEKRYSCTRSQTPTSQCIQGATVNIVIAVECAILCIRQPSVIPSGIELGE